MNYRAQLPSKQDQTQLEVSVQYYGPGPDRASSSSPDLAGVSTKRQGAPAVIITHPYGPLGGDKMNNVVRAVQDGFSRAGWLAIAMDFRGCGGSKGRTSWTGLGEVQDLETVVEAVLRLEKDPMGKSVLEKQGAKGPRVSFATDVPLPRPTQLLLVGYSYGAMITHQCLLNWGNKTGSSHDPGIRLGTDQEGAAGIGLGSEADDGLSINVGGDDFGLTPSPVPIPLATILISYPVSVTWALTACHSPISRFPLPSIPLLWVYGTKDQFTSPSSYISWWKAALTAVGNGEEGMRSCVGIPEVDHFWGRAEGRLLGEIHGWLSTLSQKSRLEGNKDLEWMCPSPL